MRSPKGSGGQLRLAIAAFLAPLAVNAHPDKFGGEGEFEEEKRLAYQGDTKALALRIRDGFDPHTRFAKPFFFVYKSGRSVLTNPGANLLHLAALSRSEQTVEFLLRLKVNHDQPDEEGFTPLHNAARGNSAAVCRMLLAAGADPDRVNKMGESPLYLAMQFSRPDVVKILIEKLVESGVALGDRAPGPRKSLLAAAISKHGMWPLVSPHLATLPIEPKEFKDALGVFAARGDPDTARKMLDHLDVDSLDSLHVLRMLAELGKPEMLKTALERGADPNARTNTGETPLHIASYHATRTSWTDSRLIGAPAAPANLPLLENQPGIPPGAPPPSMDSPAAKCMAILLKHGADINARDDHGLTPLHTAVLVEQPEEARRLTGRFPVAHTLHLVGGATEWFNHSVYRAAHVTEWLLDRGADPDVKDGAGRTPLDLAKTKATRDLFAPDVP